MKSIKKFIIQFLKIFIIFNLILSIINIAIFNTILISNLNYPGWEIYYSIQKSKKKNHPVKALVLGDSVANQIYNNKEYNDTIYSLTCNQGISMAGYYFLLKNFIDKNEYSIKNKNVYLVVVPQTLKNDMNQIYTYHYFLKPFYKIPYKKELSDYAKEQINKIPYHYFSQLPFIKITHWSPDVYIDKKFTNHIYLSPISVEYLIKIKKLSEKYNFNFKIISGFLNENNKDFNFAILNNQIQHYSFQEELDDYINSIEYFSDELFKDGSHLKNPEILGFNYLRF